MVKKAKKIYVGGIVKNGKYGAPGSNLVERNPLVSDSSKRLNEDGFDLEDDHTCLEIDRYYADKQPSWINRDFDLQVES